MIKSTIQLIIIIPLIYCCCERKESTRTPIRFTRFEIGYSNGWTTGISFSVDSNKIFFAPQKSDSVKYGLIPDSIFKVIDTTLQKVISDTTIKNRDLSCEDCSVFGLQAIIGRDTINIHQRGDIDNVFTPLIKTIQHFIDSTSHPTIRSLFFLESQKIAFPPSLPPIPNNRKFLPPETVMKSGR